MLKGNNSFIGILATTSVVKGNKGNFTHVWLTYYTKFDCQNLTWTKILLLFMRQKYFNCSFWNFHLFETFHCCSCRKKILQWNLKSVMWLELSSYMTYFLYKQIQDVFEDKHYLSLELLCSHLFIRTGLVCSFKLTFSEKSESEL